MCSSLHKYADNNIDTPACSGFIGSHDKLNFWIWISCHSCTWQPQQPKNWQQCLFDQQEKIAAIAVTIYKKLLKITHNLTLQLPRLQQLAATLFVYQILTVGEKKSFAAHFCVLPLYCLQMIKKLMLYFWSLFSLPFGVSDALLSLSKYLMN